MIRDVAEARGIGFPVFALGIIPIPRTKSAVEPLNVPVQCAGPVKDALQTGQHRRSFASPCEKDARPPLRSGAMIWPMVGGEGSEPPRPFPGSGGAVDRSRGPFATDPRVVAEQAGMVAAAWSPVGAPPSWRLTAAQFETLAEDEELLQIAAMIPGERLPPLLFEAAASLLVLELEPRPLRDWFPRVGEPQPPLDAGFRNEYRAFCLDHRERLAELCARHRYQMNEVGRCAGLLVALEPSVRDGREVVLVDVGTGAGLALHLDRYRYLFRGPGARRATVGDPDSTVMIESEVRGTLAPAVPSALPRVIDRVGIDTEPLDLRDPDVRAWLAACVPQEIGAVTRFHHAVQVAIAHPTRSVRGDACDVLPDLLAKIPDGPLVCLTDSYVHVFFDAEELRRFRVIVDQAGARRDLDWISIDPLVPMGPAADATVMGIPVPQTLLERNRREGVIGVIARLSYRHACPSGALLGLAHPSAAWLQWLAPAQAAASDPPGTDHL